MNHQDLPNRPRHRAVRSGRVALWIATLLMAACGSEPPPDSPQPTRAGGPDHVVRALDPPAQEASLAPHLARTADGVMLTWLEPTVTGHAFRMARLQEDTWSLPGLVAMGTGFFANWADLPGAVEATDGTLFAHWLAKLGEDTYAYGVQLARSRDGGTTWDELGWLHDDASPTEHGFVSYAALPEGGVQAFWLDGRAMPTGGGMQLRTTRLVGDDGPGASSLLDDRVCECCATDAALAADGPVVVYRDRSPSEIRDISVVRATSDGWSEPARIHDDGWQIQGCPVNGPAIAADKQRLAVAWFTSAEGQPKVQVVHSADGGATFGEPIRVDEGQPLGRVDLAMTPEGGAVVSWMGSSEHGAEIHWRQVSATGEVGPVGIVAATTASRSAGVPRMVRRGDELFFVWVEEGEPGEAGEAARLRAASIPLS